MSAQAPPNPDTADSQDASPACVLVFNTNDPSGAGGLAADTTAIASVGGHALPVMTGAYARDTREVQDHFALDDEAVADQARAVLEDIPVQVIKVGFAGTPENLSSIAEICSDYADVPVVTYMPDLSWWDDEHIENYLDACKELLLPLTSVLVGNHRTLTRWLLPDWTSERTPSARDLAKAASEHGVPYTLVTGIPLPEQHVDNVLSSPESILCNTRFELFDAAFSGAGDTLSAALSALLSTGMDLSEATQEALAYLDRCLDDGFRAGMGHVIPDRLFWAAPDADETDDENDTTSSSETLDAFVMPPHDTKH